jgi:hypothetical protein
LGWSGNKFRRDTRASSTATSRAGGARDHSPTRRGTTSAGQSCSWPPLQHCMTVRIPARPVFSLCTDQRMALRSYGAATGLMELGRAGAHAEMSRWPTGQGDHAASMSAVAGVGLALNQRHTTGKGQLVDVSLLRAGAWANSHRCACTAIISDTTQARRYPLLRGRTETTGSTMIRAA